MRHDPFDYDRPFASPFELVPIANGAEHSLPAGFRDRVAIYTPHDGYAIPSQYRFYPDGSPRVDPQVLESEYIRHRDWGANLVAEKLASALGLAHYGRVRVARVLMDFNRLPGSTPVGVDHHQLDTLAISAPFNELLDHHSKTSLLERYYDVISAQMETLIANKIIGISIHTYDEHNPSTTKRADISMVSVPKAYQTEARLTYGVFDPMYPDALAESTCSRVLRDRMSLNLERSDYRVSHNHPYSMPDGAIELRAQVWFFFSYVRARFERECPDTRGQPAYELVWTMLLGTNLRLQLAEELRSYLHRFRKVRPSRVAGFEDALHAYRHVRDYVHDSGVVTDFRRSPERLSSIGIEVRKDLLCTVDPETGRPLPPTAEQQARAQHIGEVIAGAIETYFSTDRTALESATKH